MKQCELCLCQFCPKSKVECDNCLMCIGTPNQKPIGICPDFPNDTKNKRANFGIIDDYREHDPKEICRVILPLLTDKDGNPFATEENIEDILDKMFGGNDAKE